MHYNGMCVTYTTSNKKNEWMWKERRKMQTVGFEPTRANTLRPERSTLDHSVIFACDENWKRGYVRNASLIHSHSFCLIQGPVLIST